VPETVVIIHNPVHGQASADEQDVLTQASQVASALEESGYRVRVMPFDLRSEAYAAELKRLRPLCAFNLVESVDGDGRLIHWACSFLDHLKIPYTGAGSEAMFLTSNKVLAKKWMHSSGIPTPPWLVPGNRTRCRCPFPGEYIVKALWEEASIGMDETSVVTALSRGELEALVNARAGRMGHECFAERFIDGREFNLSILAGVQGPQVLPPAEIRFDFPPGRKRIVDYRAKWDEESLEYRATRRSFEFAPDDAPLLERLESLALRCWRLFELKGYARVDFRVDGEGNPFVLEINANPCISPDSGFVAAAARAGILFWELACRIVADATKSR
jgi:D-alanine-D-alanine ligase